ncbi:MAG: prepilin peptidase [Sphingomonas sp.]
MPLALAALLASAGIEDVRRREIANWKNALVALLAPCWWYASGLSLFPDIAVQIVFASIIFGLFLIPFAVGQMGGGDVKLIGALALWLPLAALEQMLIVMSLAGGVLTLLIMGDRWRLKKTGPPEIPYGVAIVIAGLIAAQEPIFNHFA